MAEPKSIIEQQVGADSEHLTAVDHFIGAFKGDGQIDYLKGRAAANKAAKDAADVASRAQRLKPPK